MNFLEAIYPAPGLAFIKHVVTAETYAGGTIIIPDQIRDKVAQQQMIVVMVGDYERCADPDECNRPHHKGFLHKHRLQEGDWVLCRNRQWLATPDPEVYVIRQCHILGIFKESE